jgi:hypothetical protein
MMETFDVDEMNNEAQISLCVGEATSSLDALPLVEVYVLFLHGSGRSTGTYYSCPGWMSECN